jgi:hypothetical protein
MMPRRDSAEARLIGLCGLTDVAPALAEGRALLVRFPGDAVLVLEELVLHVGRPAGWLDLGIPWQGLSDAMVAALGERGGGAPSGGKPA